MPLSFSRKPIKSSINPSGIGSSSTQTKKAEKKRKSKSELAAALGPALASGSGAPPSDITERNEKKKMKKSVVSDQETSGGGKRKEERESFNVPVLSSVEEQEEGEPLKRKERRRGVDPVISAPVHSPEPVSFEPRPVLVNLSISSEEDILTLVTTREQEAEGEKLITRGLWARLSSAIPDQDHHLGLAFADNMAEGFPDSVGMHLLGYSVMKTSEDANVEVHSRYAREVFRATATAHQKKIVREHPESMIDEAMSAIHDLGIFFDHLKDSHDRSERGLLYLTEDHENLQKSILDRDYWRREAGDWRYKAKIMAQDVKTKRAAIAY